jgi:hypothetical protein
VLTLPVPTVGVRQIHLSVPALPRIGAPGPRAVTAQVTHEVVEATQAVRERLPEPGRLAYYAGLGALAVVGAVSWPVAGAIGVGVWLAGRRRAGSTTAPS